MVDKLHSEVAPRPESEAQSRPIAARAPHIAAQIRQSEADSQTEPGYFFRGFVIFLAIAAVFWIAVIGLIRLI
jgi:hypothetical protein